MTIALAFLNPFLLWALPLAAIPIVIHLLNRRRFDKRPWAAMEFLLRAMKRNRRRLQMEQWLVLLLRTLAVLLLVMLVARPRLTGGVLGTDITHHVVCVDDSASMAHRGGADDAMDRAKEGVERLASRLANEREGDVFTLMRSSAVARPALAVVPVGADLPRRVREALASFRPGDLAMDPSAALQAMATAAEQAKEVASRAEHYVVTDLRRRDWAATDGTPNPAFTTWLGGLDAEAAHLTLVDVGGRDSENVQVSALRMADRVCVAGVPVRIAVDVTNRGHSPSAPAELVVEVDRSRFVQPVPALAPGEGETVEFEQTFRAPGWHGVRAQLPGDRYAPDDARSLALEVRPASRALLVDGDPGEDLEASETYFLNVALDPGGDVTTGVDVRVLADHELATLSDEELFDADLIWLCNVSRLTPEVAERLEQFARGGGGIVIWLGDQVDVANYDATLWKDGHGILPLQLVGVDGDIAEPRPVHLAAGDHPLFAKATDQLRMLFAELVLVGRWITMREDPNAPVEILLRVGDADGPVLMAARPFEDGGRVHVIGTTADGSWTNLPGQFVFPILVDRLNATSSRPQDLSRFDLRPDGAFRIDVDPAIYRPDVEVRPLGDEGETRTFAAPPSGSDVVALTIPMAEIEGLGLFEVARYAHAGGRDTTLLARNPLLEEGELEPIAAGTLLAGLPPEVRPLVTIHEGAGSVMTHDTTGGGMWRLLGLLMLAGMLAETVLAWRFGRR